VRHRTTVSAHTERWRASSPTTVWSRLDPEDATSNRSSPTRRIHRRICAHLDAVRPITTSAMSSVVAVLPTRCRMMSAATRSGGLELSHRGGAPDQRRWTHRAARSGRLYRTRRQSRVRE
jgi:hypothetical protein